MPKTRAPVFPISEAAFQDFVIEAARTLGWRCAHFRSAQTKHGWRTPVAADGAGFPDLILVRDRVIAAELKAERGPVAPRQREWLAAFQAAGVEAYIWRPSGAGVVLEILKRKAGAGAG